MNTLVERNIKQTLLSDIKLYNRLLKFAYPYRWYLAIGLGFVAIYALTNPAIAALMKPLLDGTFVQRDPLLVFWMPIIMIVLFAVRGITGYLNNVTMSWVSGKSGLDIQTQMIDKVVTLPTSFYDENPTAQVVVRISSDVDSLTNAASNVLITVIRESLSIIGLLIWIFVLDWVLTLAVLVTTPLVVTLVRYVARRLRFLHHQSMEMGGRLLQRLMETASFHQIVKLYQTEQTESARISDVANNVRRYKLKLGMASGLTVPITEFITALATAAVVYLTLTRDLTDPLTVGGFVSFMAALALLTSSVKRLLAVNDALQQGLVAAERILPLINQESERDTGNREIDSRNLQGRTTFKNITFSYSQSNKSSLQNVSLEIEPNQTVALVGASGSGKSTLTALIPRLYNLQEGQLLIDGVDIRKIKLSELRKLIAFVSQDVFLFDDTIAANIAYGDVNNTTEERIRKAAKSAYAIDFIEALPSGFDTLVGEQGVRLSGGQKQRIAIARAFVKDAPILILDEATSSLDTKSEYQVRRAIDALGEGRTVIIVAHRLPSIKEVDRIVVMSKGEIVEQGTHRDLLERKGYYYELNSVYETA